LVCLGVNIALPFLQPGGGEAVPSLALFIGRFHPMVLHMPIGFVALAAMVEIGRLPFLRGLAGEISLHLTTFLLLCSTLAATVTTICGWLLSFSGGYDEKLLNAHFNAGIATAIALAVALALQTAAPVGRLSAAYRVVFLAACLFITVAGHKGSELTHGETYLTEYAPNFVRKMLGLPPLADPTATPPASEKEVYLGVIQPIFDQKCTSCHGASKSKGGLRLDSFEHAKKGGDDGPGFVANNPAKSPILHRIQLPASDDDHMPPTGKPQLTPNEIALVAWWINAGAPEKGPLSSFNPPAELVSSLGAEAAPQNSADQKQAAVEVEKSLTSVRENLKGSIKAIVPGEKSLQYVAGGDYAVVDDSQIARLAPIAAQIRLLDLNRAAITDASAPAIAAMTNLDSLSLQGTKIGDATIEAISALPNLTVINIYGTKVTDTGLAALAKLPKLRALYLWQTPTTPEGEKKLLEAKPGLQIFGEKPPQT
jgi:mono/diheme cytochrome c family protein/uncharacterized membrane protein